MAESLKIFDQRFEEDWLIGISSQEFWQHTQQAQHDFENRLRFRANQEQPGVVFLVEKDPVCFLASFIAACSKPCYLFLGNPNWTEREWSQVLRLVHPDWVIGDDLALRFQPIHEGLPQRLPPLPGDTSTLIMIPTGGSSGQIRFAMHTWETLMASVKGFRQYFGVEQVNSFCVLPLYHVSGLMQFMRSFTSGGKLAIAPFKTIVTGDLPSFSPSDFFLSLVPTQLQRLLSGSNHLIDWLTQFKTVLLGGAPAWSELLESARQLKIRLAPTYGMTETASQIATLQPDTFLLGQTGCGQPLPHVKIQIRNEAGALLAANQIGRITIQAKSLMWGYFPDRLLVAQFTPDDMGFLDHDGFLHIVGRQGDKIITGGENVYPAEVESALWETGLVQDVCVMGMDHSAWGQMVTAIYVATSDVSVDDLKVAIAPRLCKYKHPKRWIQVPQLPRNAQGKVNRQQVKDLILHQIAQTTE